MSLRDALLGRSLRSEEDLKERIGTGRGVAVLGLDALASAAYGPEAALTVLLPLGALASLQLAPILGVIVVVLLTVYSSYRQTIAAYPGGGGSYTVASQNLGRIPGVLAASALGLDYILNVAVAIAAGVGAIVSAFPALLPHTLVMCLGVLALLTLVNLRGVSQTGLVLLSPTWLFVGTLGLVIVAGVVKSIASGGHPAPVAPPKPPAETALTAASAWLLVRAFANGTTAMTGVEAVSNGVPLFREPAVRHARRTLGVIVGLLIAFLVGIGYLSRTYGIVATEPGQPGYESVLSQLYGAVAGRGAFYFVAMAALLCVLCLSANTSFADFPRLCRLLALDGLLPATFAHRGARLVFTHGIVLLAGLAAVLLIVFAGITDRLIPLFAIGALLAFTMSQWGMVEHWRRAKGQRLARHSMWINGLGAVATSVTVVIVLISKLTEGAWISVLVIGAFMALLLAARRRYERTELSVGADMANLAPLVMHEVEPPIVVVPVRRLDRVARSALEMASTLSPDVEAVQVLTDDPRETDLRPYWHRLVEDPARGTGRPPVQLITIPSAYRELVRPLLAHIRAVAAANPRRYVAVVVPELVRRRWYQAVFPSRAMLLELALRYRGGPQIVIIDAPWQMT